MYVVVLWCMYNLTTSTSKKKKKKAIDNDVSKGCVINSRFLVHLKIKIQWLLAFCDK